MMRIIASLTKAATVRAYRSKSRAKRRLRLIQARVLSTIQRLGRTTNLCSSLPALQIEKNTHLTIYFAEAAGAAAKFLARPDGPRVGALALDGWDTHVNEGAVKGRLADMLGGLDGAIAAIETNMGDAWPDTVVALVTEFGRTAHINGNDGTDHGTATAALFAGGALKGGRVVADWPGLRDADLHD
jgi:uncharacterized protein (DUF1501 family)